MENTKRLVAESELAEIIQNRISLSNTSIKECEILLNNFGQKLFSSGEELYVNVNEEYYVIDIDDVIDAACDNCYESLSGTREEIIKCIDDDKTDAANGCLQSYVAKKNEMAVLDGLFETTKYASIISIQAQKLKDNNGVFENRSVGMFK